ncbi:MAG: hypothetical protein FWF76_04490 [Oscillospiraceae bacterium]|nr:hypothetical protein [Oscillospiraceae bacterium]
MDRFQTGQTERTGSVRKRPIANPPPRVYKGIKNKAVKPSNSSGNKSFFEKLYAFFNNKWTKLGFSFISLGYLSFLLWITWLTFAYNFVYDNAVALFFVYSFINAMFAVAMIYTRRCILTRLSVLVMHPILIIMLIYGFGNWYLILPPLIAATLVFLISGVNESLKIILGTIYMILFVLAILAYITLARLHMTGDVLGKLDLNLRVVPEISMTYEPDSNDYKQPFRLVAYVDTRRQNPTVNFFVEQTTLNRELWNFTAQRVHGSVRIGATGYRRGENEDIIWEIIGAIEWRSSNELWFDGRMIEFDEYGQIIAGNINIIDDYGTDGTEPPTIRPPRPMGAIE